MQNCSIITTNFCSHVTEHHGTSLGGWSVSMSTKRNKWVSQTCAIFKSWELTQLTSECKVCQLLDPFVHQPYGTQNCWTLPELSVSSLLAPRLGLPNLWIFRLRTMWKYNEGDFGTFRSNFITFRFVMLVPVWSCYGSKAWMPDVRRLRPLGCDSSTCVSI